MSLVQIFLFVLGFVLLIGGAELLVNGASRLAGAIGIPPLVVGLTIVAYGTSAPELAVTLQAVFAETPQPDLAIGNVVGSNISNILLVLGVSAFAFPIGVSKTIIRTGVPLMIATAVGVLCFSINGTIDRWEGGALVLCAIAYTIFAVARGRQEVREEREQSADGESTDEPSSARTLVVDIVYMLFGLAGLVGGARLLVEGAVMLARIWNVDELVIGLTIVAVGTSLPEIATSLVAGYRGHRDLAVGNVVGSNIFNLLLVLGATATLSPVPLDVPQSALRFDIPVMLAVSCVCLPIFFTGFKISRWEGIVFLGYYIAYNVFLFMKSTDHDALKPFSLVLLGFVIPLSVVTLLALTVQAWRKQGGLPEASGE